MSMAEARQDKQLVASVVLEQPGHYQAMLIVSDQSIPTRTISLENVASEVLEAGGRVELGDPVLVR